MFARYSLQIFAVMCVLLLGACATAVPPSKGSYKVGKPYVINGVRYVPGVDYGYSETGIASWYGPGFHGKRTANGERFDQNELTAAHRTLPMPSLVRVTNLDNGKSIVARVNDRGPFSRNRIIDVSKRGAELLGFKLQGTAKVRVDVLEDESKRIAEIAKSGGDTRRMENAMQHVARNRSVPVSTTPTPQPSLKLKTRNRYVVSGHLAQGEFYPDHVVGQEVVKPSHVFVQVGAFSDRMNAEKLAERLSEFGETRLSPVTANGQTYHRVRVIVEDDSVDAADRLLERVENAGYKNALIIVD